MSLQEAQQKLSCRHCGRPRIITRVSKPKPNQVALYMLCPVHRSEVVWRLPLDQYEPVSHLIREHVLLCRKCGSPVDIVGQRTLKLTTKIQIHCPTHGGGERSVNNSLLDPVLKAIPNGQQPAGTYASKYCSSCGVEVPAPEARFCHRCGASLD
ncbi:MAG: zinc-ribbon domain-containing protein [Candidatus Hodarchaeota archaeon]